METIYPSMRAQVTVSTFFMKFPILIIPYKLPLTLFFFVINEYSRALLWVRMSLDDVVIIMSIPRRLVLTTRRQAQTRTRYNNRDRI